jgi:gluconate kinase
MTNEIYLICGVQGSGKTWVCQQLREQSEAYYYIPHDQCWYHKDTSPEEMPTAGWGPPGSISTHFPTLVGEADESDVPIITEVPFGERNLRDQLTSTGFRVTCIFVVEPVEVLKERYSKREGKPLSQSAITRSLTLEQRARDWDCFYGTSEEVLSHLLDIVAAHEVNASA